MLAMRYGIFSVFSIFILVAACGNSADDTSDPGSGYYGGAAGSSDAGAGGGSGEAGAAGGAQTQEQDIAQYEALTTQLETKRSEFLTKKASNPNAVGNRLFWQEFDSISPTLHSFESVSGGQTSYDFSIGSQDDANYAASDSLVVTALRMGDKVVYSAYAVDAPKQLVASASIDAPQDEQKWWAYSTSGKDVYIVLARPGNNVIQKWTPGSGQPADFASLDDAIAPNKLGEFRDFAVDGNTMIFDEGGRLWLLDLPTKKAISLQNTEESGSSFFGQDSVVYSEATKGLWLFDVASKTRKNLSDLIKANPYKLNKTYAEGHFYTGNGWTRSNSKIVYIGQGSGLYSYDLVKSEIKPILLQPRLMTGSLFYKYPQILTDGTIFVQGLVSDSGSVGADGPLYKIDKSALN